MLKSWIFASVVAAALPVAAAAATKTPETLSRTGSWVLDYDRDACHLAAQFGTGKDVMVMRLTRYEPGDWFDLSLYGRRLASPGTRSEASIDFGLGGKPFETDAMNGKAARLPLMLLGSMRLDGWRRAGPDDIPPVLTPEQEAAVSGATVKIEGKGAFRLAFGSLAKPMAQLRACQTDLVKSWGYDPVVQASLAKPVRPTSSPGEWLRPGDYPPGAIHAGQNGIVQFRLDVDPDGKISGCHVLARTSPDVFADTTCRNVTRRARLEPALDADGRPVRSFDVQKVLWRMSE
jgi:TonB family protein